MPPTRAAAQHFSASRNLESLGHRLPRFDAFWTSHNKFNFLSKRARNIDATATRIKRYFSPILHSSCAVFQQLDLAGFDAHPLIPLQLFPSSSTREKHLPRAEVLRLE